MKIAIEKCDITPQRPCWQGGYVQREKFYEKVHDPIMATIFVLTLSNAKLVWIGMDVSGVQQELSDLILRKVNQKGVALKQRDLIFGASHTHSGPLVGTYFDRKIDQEYMDTMTEDLANAIVCAYNQEGKTVTAKFSSAVIDGLYSNRNDRNKLSDKTVSMIGFFEQERLLGLYCTLAHHCTILGPNFMELSADLFGEMRRLLEEKFQATVLMAQGNAGDMGNKQYRKSNLFDEVVNQAANLVDQIQKKRSPWVDFDMENCHWHEHEFLASYDVDVTVFEKKKAEFEKQLETETNFDTIKLLVTGIKSFERKIQLGSRHVDRKMPYRIYDFDELQLVAVPGELGSILGMRIKAASKAKLCLVWAYVDPCHLGYMIEKEAYEGFSQESNVTDYPAGICDAFVEDIIKHL